MCISWCCRTKQEEGMKKPLDDSFQEEKKEFYLRTKFRSNSSPQPSVFTFTVPLTPCSWWTAGMESIRERRQTSCCLQPVICPQPVICKTASAAGWAPLITSELGGFMPWGRLLRPREEVEEEQAAGRLAQRCGGGWRFKLPALFWDVGSPELSDQAGIKM